MIEVDHIGALIGLIAMTALAPIPTPQSAPTDPHAVVSAQAANVVPVSAQDIMSSPSVQDVAWSADDKALFLSTNLSGRYNIWKMEAHGGWPVRVTQSDEEQRGLVALPDGKTLLYLQDKAGDENTDIYAISVDGGSPVNLTSTADVAEAGIKVSPDGASIAFTYKPKTSSQRDIAIMNLATHAVRIVTQHESPGGFWSIAGWSADGRQIIANRQSNLLSRDCTVWQLDVATQRSTQLIPTRPLGHDQAIGLSADGRSLVVTSDYQSAQLRAGSYDLKTGRYRWFQSTPWEQMAVALSPDGRTALVRTLEDGRVSLSSVDLATLRQNALSFPAGVNEPFGWPYNRDGQPFSHRSTDVVASHSAGDAPPAIFSADLAAATIGVPARLASAALAPGKLPKSSVITYRSFDGTLVSGVLTMPFNLTRNASHPALVMPHGGPTDASYDNFNAKAAYLASHGYVVLQPNYRGSTGYGAAFEKAEQHDMGGGDLGDVVAAKDFLVATGYVDPRKVGITGASAGGWLTMLALGKRPDVFAVGVESVGIFDWYTLMQHTDPVLYSYGLSLLGAPDKERKAYAEASPNTYIKDIKAPLLLLAGARDIRVPVQQAVQARDTLKAGGVVSDLAVYPDEGHNFMKRENEIDELERTLGWFDRYLKAIK